MKKICITALGIILALALRACRDGEEALELAAGLDLGCHGLEAVVRVH